MDDDYSHVIINLKHKLTVIEQTPIINIITRENVNELKRSIPSSVRSGFRFQICNEIFHDQNNRLSEILLDGFPEFYLTENKKKKSQNKINFGIIFLLFLLLALISVIAAIWVG